MDRLLEFSINHWDLVVALIIILMMMFGGGIMRRIRGYKEVVAFDAVALMNRQDAIYVDVREDKEYAEGHVLDSIHIPLGQLINRITELDSYRAQPIIVGCRSGNRSAMGCARLRKQGFEQVYNLKGGILAWQNANLPLESGTKRKKKRKG
ncbi:MAG: rhodanese-like domain-containing protein [Gammaproteobacteria bacterium]|nr:rhodanese-like domain-containing protein [Gammaproteobacteria bacterium]MCW8888033.1 rhodanese-like domain-containing protein [Gammaproteobacteria bacterium]